jgi:hypothetical protein
LRRQNRPLLCRLQHAPGLAFAGVDVGDRFVDDVDPVALVLIMQHLAQEGLGLLEIVE